MRFHHVITLIFIALVFIAYALFLADQIALIRLQVAVGISGGELRP